MEIHSPTVHQPEQDSLFPQNEIPYCHDYKVLTSPESNGEDLRAQYAHLTDKLIHRIQSEKPDHLIFLDKSARPVAWMLKELWPIMAADEKGDVAELPTINFLNIDREQWRIFVKDDESEIIDVDRLPGKKFQDLRSIFTLKPTDDLNTFEHKSVFDNSKIMIIDEVRVSGDTLKIASNMLQRAFPGTEISQTWWMTPKIVNKPGQPPGNSDLPIWYSDENVKGRGVGNRDNSKSSTSTSSRQRRGKEFLSTRFRTVDEKGRQLRDEIKYMARDIMEGRLVVKPDLQRADYAAQFERINGITFQNYEARNSIKYN